MTPTYLRTNSTRHIVCWGIVMYNTRDIYKKAFQITIYNVSSPVAQVQMRDPK